PLCRRNSPYVPACAIHPHAAPSARYLFVGLFPELLLRESLRQRSHRSVSLLPRISAHHVLLAKRASKAGAARRTLGGSAKGYGNMAAPHARFHRPAVGSGLSGISPHRSGGADRQQMAGASEDHYRIRGPLASLREAPGATAPFNCCGE